MLRKNDYKYFKKFIIFTFTFLIMLFSLVTATTLNSYDTKAVTVSISISPSAVNTYVGKTKQLKAIVKNTSDTVKWSSSNTSLATVDKKGLVKTKKAGNVVIKAKVKNKVASCKFTIYSYTNKLEISKSTVNLYPKQSLTLALKIYPSTAYQSGISWKSSNNSIASVSGSGKTGKITARRVGNCVVTATTKDGKRSRSCKVYVRQAVKKLIVKNPQDIYTGRKTNLNVRISPSNAYNKGIAYRSENENIAKVDGKGNVTPVSSSGKTKIVCKAKDGQGAKTVVTINIRQSVTALNFDKESLVVGTGGKKTLVPKIEPKNAYNKKLKYKSSNVKVAKVDSNGNVKGISVGEAIITATTTDGSNISASYLVKVELSATKLSIEDYIKIPINHKYKTLTLSVEPSNASTSQIKWVSENEDVVSVDSSGKLSLKKYGTTYVYCYNDNGTNLISNKCRITVYKKYVSSVKLNRTSLSLNERNNYTLIAKVYDSDATDQRLYWYSTNKKIATVTQSGIIEAKSKGTCKIYVKARDGSNKKDFVKLTVKRLIRKITCTQKVNINVGSRKKIKINIYPSSASNKKLKYTVSNKNVKYNSKNKTIYAKHKGYSTIVFYTKDGSCLKTKCRIIVKQPVKKVNINYRSAVLNKGKKLKLKAYVYPSSANNKKIRWYSTNSKIATVNSKGIVKTKNKGTCKIYAKAKDGSGKKDYCKVIVKQPVEKVDINYRSATLNKGNSLKLKAYVYPSSANNKKIKWYSTNSKIATVDSKGIVKTKSKGTCKIYAKAKDGSGKKDYCKVTVRQPVTKITMNYSKLSMYQTSIVKLSAKAYPTNANNREIRWYSSNNKVATVSGGTVKAVGKGTCYITACSGYNDKRKLCKITVYKGSGKMFVPGFKNNGYCTSIKESSSYVGKIMKLSKNSRNAIVKFIGNAVGLSGDYKTYCLFAQTIHDYLNSNNINCYNVSSVKNSFDNISPAYENAPDIYDNSLSSYNKEKIRKAVSFIFDHGGIAAKHRLRYIYKASDKTTSQQAKRTNVIIYCSNDNPEYMLRYYD